MISNIDKPLMFHNIKEEIIYASAYIDGEGHIEFKTRLKKNGRGKIYPCKAIRIEVCNTDFKPVEDLKNLFDCGFISYPKRRRKKNDPSYKIIKSHYSRINQLIKNSKAKKTMELLGCSRDFFIDHLKKQFTKGMTIENYGTFWHVDHIIPLYTFKNLTTSLEAQTIAFNYKNTRPLKAQDNLRRPKGLKSKNF